LNPQGWSRAANGVRLPIRQETASCAGLAGQDCRETQVCAKQADAIVDVEAVLSQRAIQWGEGLRKPSLA
jgi:hypothetical protein